MHSDAIVVGAILFILAVQLVWLAAAHAKLKLLEAIVEHTMAPGAPGAPKRARPKLVPPPPDRRV